MRRLQAAAAYDCPSSGIEPERVKLVWASAAEGIHLAHEITDFVDEIKALGRSTGRPPLVGER